ncbi:hypothetical protein UGMREWDR_CDS0125 [Aeromonas phage GomatiRiver_11]|nr:hypothetical protein OBDJBBDK_00116 [Aeromonas phage AhFM11]WKW84292.1 hypothetical protein UGMREWDR_CDS0125 [Aeromonas phage GomatiRiver_11]
MSKQNSNFIAVRNFTVHTAAARFTLENVMGRQITEEQITEVENEVWEAVQKAGVTGVGRRAIRGLIVSYIAEEFGTEPLGHKADHVGYKQVDEDSYKKYATKARKIRKEMYGSKR